MSFPLKPLALMALALAAGTAAAEEYHGFVKNQYYLGRGGETVGLSAFAADPSKYVRSFAAYKGLKEHFEKVVGKPLTDEEFRALIRSEDVRLVKCVGRINTAGITDKGEQGWHERACYKNEYLIEVRVPGGWMTVASQGCYNPVEGERPPPPPPPPPAPPPPPPPAPPPPPPKMVEAPPPEKRCMIVSTGQSARRGESQWVNLQPLYGQGSCGPIYMPGNSAVVQGGITTSQSYTVICDQ